MKTSKELLDNLLKTTQMGQSGIRSVLDAPMRPALRQALESQLREYDAIEQEAQDIMRRRNWPAAEADPVVQGLSAMVSRAKLSYGNTDSKIASMMIQGNTKGMISGIRDMHQFPQQDTAVSTLAQKLIDTETSNIRQMKTFL